MAVGVPGSRTRAPGRSCWRGLVAAAAAGSLAACGSGTPAPRGFGSRLLVPTRDRTLIFSSVGNGIANYQTSADGGTTSWTLDLTTGQLQPPSSPDGGAGAGAGGTGFTCDYTVDAQSNTEVFTLTNHATGQQIPVDGVTADLGCPTDTYPMLTVLRADASGAQTLWSGPPDQLQPVALPVTIADVLIIDYRRTVWVLAGAQPDALGIFSIDLTTFAVTELVPATLGASAWAPGATGTATLASTSVLLPPANAPNATTPLLQGHFLYERAMTDGSTIVFAGPFASGPATELALFELAPSGLLAPSPQLFTSTGANVRLFAFQYQSDPSQPFTLFVWNDGNQQLLGCPLPDALHTQGLASADGTQLLIGAAPPTSAGDPGNFFGAAVLASLPSAPGVASPGCTILGDGNVNFAGFSLTGNDVFWLTDHTTLWTASGDGTNARQIGMDDIGDPRFAVGTELEMLLAGDLVWVDVTDLSNTTSDIAVRAFGDVYDFGATARGTEGQWLITGYDLSGQDGTGSLAIFNRNTPGKQQLISSEVASYMVGRAGPTPDGGVPTLDVVYLVRGRNPSAEDGIWAATIDEAAFGN